MKKYITVAALLAAGTAFANAADIIKCDEIGDYKEMGGYPAGFPVPYEWSLGGTQSFDSEWSLVFTVNAGSFGTNKLTLLALDTNNGEAEADNFSGLYGVTYDGSKVDLTYFDGKVVPGNSVSTAQKDVTFVLSRTSNKAVSLTAYADGIFNSSLWSVQTTANQTYSSAKLATMNFGGYDTDFAPGATFLGNDAVSSYQLLDAGYSFGSVASESDLNVYYHGTAVVPEPSAFGLLAGIGALALVAARRRRKA